MQCRTFNTVNGVCGGYKTTYGIDDAARRVRQLDDKIIVAQPTIKLLKEWQKYLADCHPDVPVFRFDSTTHPAVYREIVEFVTDHANDPRGCIVMVTQKALLEIPFWANQGEWDCLVDEFPVIDGECHFNIATKQSREFLALFDAIECGQPGWLEINVKKGRKAEFERFAKNHFEDDQGEEIGADTGVTAFSSLYNAVCARETTVHVSRKAWNRLAARGKAQVDFHWTKAPAVLDGWKSVTLMGANFEMTLLAKLWSDQVAFAASKTIVPTRQSYDATTGGRMKFHYFSAKPWSKELFKKLADCDRLSTDAAKKLYPIVEEVMGTNAKFGWVGNLVMADDAFKSLTDHAERIPNNPYGHNHFRHLTKIVFFSALHNSPSHFTYLSDLFGLHPEELKQARAYEIAHQAIMRSDARNHDSDQQIDVLVPDVAMASWLAALFPGSRLLAHEAGFEQRQVVGSAQRARGRPRKAVVVTNAERQVNKRLKSARIGDTKNTLKNRLFSCASRRLTLTMEQATDSQSVAGFDFVDWEDIYSQLELMADSFAPRKEANYLLNGGLCDLRTNDGQIKGKDNFSQINGIWLDIDDGKLTPEELANEIFPDLRLCVFNSFNNGKPNEETGVPQSKYHVLIETTGSSTTDAYEQIWDTLAEQIRGFGYFVGYKDAFRKLPKWSKLKWSGVDQSKRAANSFYYAPCRAGLGEEYSFFRRFTGPGRIALDPIERLDYVGSYKAPVAELPAHQNPVSPALKALREAMAAQNAEPDPAAQAARQAERIADAESYWEGIKYMDDARNHGFFVYAARLRSAGLNDYAIEQTLRMAAANSPLKDKRLKQIRSIMQSLRNGR